MIGLVGLGHLGTAMATGLLRRRPAETIVLAPRGASVRDFAAAHGCAVASDLQDLAEKCGTILISVRSDQIVPLLSGVAWREGQLLISACAGVSIARMRQAAPQAAFVRTLPLMTAAVAASPTAMHPRSERAQAIFEALGSVHVFDDEATFDIMSSTAVLFTIGHAMVGWTSDWARRNGVDPDTAQTYAAAMLEAAGCALRTDRRRLTPARLGEMATPGGLAEAALKLLNARDVPESLALCYDAAVKAAAAHSSAQ
jgi:pyrroline-5-carboxylate reductase